MIHLRRALLVAGGGVIGTAARLGLSLLIPDAAGIPVSVVTVNLVGAFFIGILAARLPRDGRDERGADLRVFLATGVLGGFTTYSAFAAGSVRLWADAPPLAVLYVIGSLVLGLLAAFAGVRLGRRRRV